MKLFILIILLFASFSFSQPDWYPKSENGQILSHIGISGALTGVHYAAMDLFFPKKEQNSLKLTNSIIVGLMPGLFNEMYDMSINGEGFNSDDMI